MFTTGYCFSHIHPCDCILSYISPDFGIDSNSFFFQIFFFLTDGMEHIETCLRIKNYDLSKLLSWLSLTGSLKWKTKQTKNINKKFSQSIAID